MPYTSRESRDRVNRTLTPETPGELNYLITMFVDRYVAAVGLRYATINEAIGVLECAKLELYRRVAAPYENVKMAKNGDVYACTKSVPKPGS